MTSKAAGGRSIEEVLGLLNDLEFCADAKRTILEAAQALAQAGRRQERQLDVETLGQRFEDRWGVTPPTSGELLDPDRRRRFSDAIAAGRWGLLAIFPWTTNAQIRAAIKRIRSIIPKQHQDALINHHAHLVRWLEACGFGRPAIARAVFKRRSGLRRPSKTQAIARTREDRESQLYEEYQALGLTPKEVERRVYRRLRGSEPLASASVRMTQKRYVNRVSHLNQDLATPVQSEPLSYALTMLYRALLHEDSAAIRNHVVTVRDAFVTTFRRSRPMSRRRERLSEREPSQIIGSAPWGIVTMYPWTPDPEIRASVKKVRALLQEPYSQNSSAAAAAARPASFEPLSDALISLFRALSDPDDIAVRRYAANAWATFAQEWAA
jgi:hypothetical protein